MPWAAAITGVATLASGAMGKSGAQKAGAQQAAAQQKALAYQEQVHDTASQQFAPFIQGGTNALGAIGQLLGINIPGSGYTGNALDTYKAYTQTPFYQFPLDQGIQAADRSAAAHGSLQSPGQLAAVNKWGQGYASQNFKDYIGTLSNLAGIASSDIGTLSGQGNQAAGNVLTAQSGIGTAQASGTVGGTNALTQMLNQLGGIAGGAAKQFGSSYGAPSQDYNYSPAVSTSAPDYSGGATPNQLSILGLPSSGVGSGTLQP
jgi:hypothetical protein